MGKKILLADDSITIQKVIELTFSDEDFEVVTVGNGRLAIERTQEVVPDVVLCDIIMPEKDGYEVCAFIKKTPALAHIPVLLLTGAFEPFDQDRAARVGCDGFLAKPFEPQTLIAKVKELLAQGRGSAGVPAAAPVAAAAAAAAAGTPAEPAEFEPLYALADEPATPDDGAFQPLEPVTEFEPLETVAFEPVAPSAPAGPAAAEREAPMTRPLPSLADEVAFIPEEPVAPAPVQSRAAAFIPEDDAFASSAAENLVPSEEPALVADEEPLSATLPPGWDRSTLEVPLEERARLSVAAAYGDLPAETESLDEPALTLESELEPEPLPRAASPAYEPSTAGMLEEEPLVEMAAEVEPSSERLEAPLEEQPAAPPDSIFEAMGLEQPAESLPAEPAVEAAPQVSGPAVSEWVPSAPEGLDEMQELAAEPEPEEIEAATGEAAGAEVLLDEDLSTPVDFGEPVGSLPESEPATPQPAAARAAAIVIPAQEPVEEPEAIAAGDLEPAEPAMAAALLEPGSEDVSFDDVAPAASAEPTRRASSAAEVAVPVDMVAQIAQRVVGQISEKVIREIAWEVIPELAEALIKKEIERLKAELQQLPQ